MGNWARPEPVTAFGLPEAIASLSELRDRKIISVNEMRVALGFDPPDAPEADDHAFTSTPYQPRRGEEPSSDDDFESAESVCLTRSRRKQMP